MIYCDHCGMSEKTVGYQIHAIPELQHDVDSANAGESAHLCHACCVVTDNLAPGYAWSRNMMTGMKIMISEDAKGKVHLDPAYETYWCM